MTEDKPIVHVADENMQEVNSHDKSVPSITLQDSSTQTEILTTVSVGTKPKTPPGVVTTGSQAVVKCSEQDAQAKTRQLFKELVDKPRVKRREASRATGPLLLTRADPKAAR